MHWKTKLLTSIIILFSIAFSGELELIVKYKDNVKKSINKSSLSIQSDDISYKTTKVTDIYKDTITLKDSYIIQASTTTDYEILKSKLENDPNIESLYPNIRIKAHKIPNDYYYNSCQQSIMNLMHIEEGWDITTGDKSIIVAVLDTGADIDNPEISSRLTNGYDFVNYDPYPDDDNGHGSHVSGIIGAIGNNGSGIAGLGWNITIMPIKILDNLGEGYTSDLILGIDYARNNGARIINMSLGSEYTEAIQEAIDNAYNAGCIIVASAGNEDNELTGNNKVSPVCNDGNNNKVIGVSSLDDNQKKSYFSNYSDNFVDVSAIGEDILSIYPDNSYKRLSGTSQAAPFVSGLAALLLSIKPSLKQQEVFSLITANCATSIYLENPSYINKLGSGLVDFYNSLSKIIIPTTTTQDTTLIYYNAPNPVESNDISKHSSIFYLESNKYISSFIITIYSLSGKKIKTIEHTSLNALYSSASWDLNDQSGYSVPKGIYIAILEANINGKTTKKYHKVLIK